MFTARFHAHRVGELYSLAYPASLKNILAGEGFHVVDFPFHPTVREVIYRRYIGINSAIRDRATRRYLVAHALGHFYLHRANQIPLMSSDACQYSRQERQADAFAEALLAPATALKKCAAQRLTLPEAAAYLGVPPALIYEPYAYTCQNSTTDYP